MKIKIDPHTLERAQERGTNAAEIKDVLNTGFEIPAKRYRKCKAKVFKFDQKLLNKFYEQKRVEVIHAVENDTIMTITVYVFYGKWKRKK